MILMQEIVDFSFQKSHKGTARGRGAYNSVIAMAKMYMDAGLLDIMFATPVDDQNRGYVLFRDNVEKSFADLRKAA